MFGDREVFCAALDTVLLCCSKDSLSSLPKSPGIINHTVVCGHRDNGEAKFQ